MAHSNRLRLGEIRYGFRLANEARDLGADPTAWRTHLIRELARRIGATVSMTLELHDFLPGALPRWIDPIDLGWEGDRERRYFVDYLESDLPKTDPSTIAWAGRMARRGFSAATRPELIDDCDWYAAPVVSEGRRSSRIDDSVVSLAALGGPGRVQGFQFYRPWGATRFSRRDRNLVRLVHVEALRFLDDRPADGATALPPYLRRTLDALLRGATAKQAASELGLSVHTIDSYRKAIYRHFGVGSFPQLAALRLDAPAPGRLRLPAGF